MTQIPTNMILDKVKPSLFLPLVMCAWAVVSTCTGAVHSFGGLVALRFILGKQFSQDDMLHLSRVD